MAFFTLQVAVANRDVASPAKPEQNKSTSINFELELARKKKYANRAQLIWLQPAIKRRYVGIWRKKKQKRSKY